jgi:hypothetical protein
MNIEVIFKDNREGQVDEALLDKMLAGDIIKMFRRSESWAMPGVDETRGNSRMLWNGLLLYTGPDRRMMSFNIMDECAFVDYAA